MSRFDYVKYDEFAAAKQAKFKAFFQDMEEEVELGLKSAIRDDQIARNGSVELQE